MDFNLARLSPARSKEHVRILHPLHRPAWAHRGEGEGQGQVHGHGKNDGGLAPSSFSKAERVVADRAAGAGAKAAAAEATRRSVPRRRRKSGARWVFHSDPNKNKYQRSTHLPIPRHARPADARSTSARPRLSQPVLGARVCRLLTLIAFELSLTKLDKISI
jgi:hypothetical protein